MYDQGLISYQFGRFRLSPSRHALYLEEAEIALTPKSFQVLLYLVKNPGRVVTKQELLQAVWAEAFIEEANLAQQIFRLRRALAASPEAENYIRTAPGLGYQFTPEVSEHAALVVRSSSGDEIGQSILLDESENSLFTPVGEGAAGYAVGRWRERTSIVVEELAPPRSRFAAAGWWVAGFLMLAAAIGGGVETWQRSRPSPPRPHQEIVLGDFDNRTGEPVFDLVLKTALAIDLQQSPELTVLSPTQMQATLRAMLRPPDTRLTREVALEACVRNDDRAVLMGSITRLDKQYLISLEAIDCASGKNLAGVKAQAGDKDAVLRTLGEIDTTMRAKLGESLQNIKGFDVPLAQATTSSLDALVALSQGATMSDAAAIPYYQRAIELDPKFALAYRGLGVAYENLGQTAEAKQAYARAYELRGPTSTAEQFSLTARYIEYVLEDLNQGAKVDAMWMKTFPQTDRVGYYIANDNNLMGRYQDAVAATKSVRTAHPSWYFYYVSSVAYMGISDMASAEAACRKGLSVYPENEILHRILQQLAFKKADTVEYDRQAQWFKGQPTEYQTLDQEGRMSASLGRLQDAQRLLMQAREIAEREGYKEYEHAVDGDTALVETLLGCSPQAQTIFHRVPVNLGENSFTAGMAAALGGDVAYTRSVMDASAKTASSQSTLVWEVRLPLLRAALALRQGADADAVKLLEPARPYERRDYYVPALLGAAYLHGHRPDEAAAQYREILSNPGIDALSPLYPLAHLGLARAYAMQAKSAMSKQEYEQLFTAWSGADADLPVLKQARQEYARLQ